MTTIDHRLAVALLAAILLGACDSGDAGDRVDAGPLPPPDQYLFGGDRQVELQIPFDYDHGRSYPLLILLHGYGANGLAQQAYLGFGRLVDDYGVLMLSPDGRLDASGNRHWEFVGPSEDVTYISGLIDDVSAVYNVDPGRVFLFGHSNGGFMSYRMACERDDVIAAIAPLAGNATDADPCAPAAPVSVLHIHGTLDTSVAYDGAAGYRSAADSVGKWAALDGCSGALEDTGATLDIDTDVAGEETHVARTAGCPAGVDAELWTLIDGDHIPTFRREFADLVWAWFDAHAR